MNLKLTTRIGLLAAGVLGIAAALSWGDNFTYVTFTDRDLLRASTFFDDFELLGSELGNRAARTPGGMMSLIAATLQLSFPSASAIHTAGTIWNIFAAVFAAFLLRRIVGINGSIAFVALFFTSISILELFWKFWNPSPTIGFAAIAYVILFRCLAGSMSSKFLILSGIFLSLAAQFHVSFLGGFGLTLAGILIAAPRRSIKFLPLILVGFLIPFIPFIVADSIQGFEWTRAFLQPMGDSRNNSINCVSCSVFLSLIKLTGGQFYLTEYLPNIGLPKALVAGLLNLLNLPLILLGIFVAYLIKRLVRRDQDSGNKHNTTVLIFLAYMLLVAPIALGPYASNANARYFVVFIIPVLVMSSMAFSILLEAQPKTPIFMNARKLLAIGLAGLLVVKALIIVGYYTTRPPETLSAYAFKRDVSRALNKDWGIKGDLTSKRSAIYIVDPSETSAGWYFLGENHGIDYIAKIQAPGETPQSADECVLIVTRLRMSGEPVKVPENLLGLLPPVFNGTSTRQRDYPNFSMVGFRPDIPGNCPRSFVHTYHLSPEQKAILKTLADDEAKDGQIHRKEISETRVQYILRFPGTDLSGLMIDVSKQKNELDIVIRSLNMGGYAVSSGRDYAFLENPGFIIESESGLKKIETLKGIMGKDGLYAPYTIKFWGLPVGKYKLRFVSGGFEIRSSVTGNNKKYGSAFDVLLDDSLAVPAVLP